MTYLNILLRCFRPSDYSPICAEDNLFYDVRKLMIVSSMQGVHHVLSRDKELVCPIKAHHQSSQKKKKKEM